MHVLIALAGFVVFLCVFGMRGLKIAGAVFGVAAVLVVGLAALILHDENERHALKAASVVRPSATGRSNCAAEYAYVTNLTDRSDLIAGCKVLWSARGGLPED